MWVLALVYSSQWEQFKLPETCAWRRKSSITFFKELSLACLIRRCLPSTNSIVKPLNRVTSAWKHLWGSTCLEKSFQPAWLMKVMWQISGSKFGSFKPGIAMARKTIASSFPLLSITCGQLWSNTVNPSNRLQYVFHLWWQPRSQPFTIQWNPS